MPTALREALQLSEFTTAGKLKTGISFVESADSALQTTSEVKGTTPKPEDITAEKPVTFTFVVRDDRGGVDWTTRSDLGVALGRTMQPAPNLGGRGLCCSRWSGLLVHVPA